MTIKAYLINFIIVLACMILGLYLYFILSGWRKLAQYYKAKQPNFIVLSRWQTGSVGTISLYNCLNIGVCEEGLFLSVTPPFYPSLLIPWKAVNKAYINSFGCYRLEVGDPYITRISLPKEALEAAEQILATKR